MWSGNDGKVYVFGGNNFEEGFFYADLWAYDTLAQQWTFVSGSQEPNAYGIYGTQGISDAMSRPGARQQAASWTDNNGNLWLFGGLGYGASTGYGELNDLWMYSAQTGLWTWVSGSSETNSYGIYGELGIPASSNSPGSRHVSAFWLLDNDLYLFGGNGFGSLSMGYLNDLWKYSIQDNQWVYLSGSMTADVQGNYGSQNIPSATNQPGSRASSSYWASENNSMLYLFGGSAAITTEQLNDLWQFDVTTNTWTWISGTSVGNHPGVSGELGLPSVNNIPAGRLGAVSFAQNNYLWLFGGYTNYYINDLWRYNIATGEWTWMGGDVFPGDLGAYFEQGPSTFPNYPSNKEAATGCASDSGKFWLFGGTGSVGGVMNDLWKLEIGVEPELFNVTFQVDMAEVIGFNIPEVNGTFNQWCGNCSAMIDGDGDNIWAVTIALPAGNYQYKYSTDFYSMQEALTPELPCTITEQAGFTNRQITINADTILPVVCWGTCSPCNPQPLNCPTLDGTLQNGLVGYWPFCGNANDESGNGNDGVVNGATLTEDRNGNANSAYSFNGINNDITIPNTLDALISNEMTVSMWFNMDDNIDHQSLFLRQGSDFTKTWILSMDGTNDIRCYNENGAYSNVTAPTSLYNAWQQLTAVFTDSMILTYINGVLVAEENVGFPLSWSSEPIILGGTEGTTNNPYPYLGSLDDVSIWNRALTQEEIALLNSDCDNAQALIVEILDNDNIIPLECGEFGYLYANINGGVGPYTFDWTDSNGNPLWGADEIGIGSWDSGMLSLSITDQCGIEATAQIDVLLNIPTLTATMPTVYSAICGSNINLTVVPAGGVTQGFGFNYEWQFNGMIDWNYWGLPTYSAPAVMEGTITVIVSDQCGQSVTIESQLVIESPALDPGIQTGLVGYWPFCGNANDESGNGYNGTVMNAALSTDRFGLENSCYHFDAQDEYIMVPNNQNLSLDSTFTISLWFNAESFQSLNCFISKSNCNDATIPGYLCGIWDFYTDGDNPKLSFQAYPYLNDAQSTLLNESGLLQINEWYHFVVQYDDLDNNLSYFLNNQLIATIEISLDIQNTDLDMIFGNHLDFIFDSCQNTFMIGALDDIGIWNRALTADEIAQLYGNFNPQVTGCTAPEACNFNALATTDDGSCTFAGDACDDGNAATTNDLLNADCSCTGTVVNCATLDGTLQEGLVGYWPFCGNANDESGNGNDGVVNGATLTEDRFGNVGRSYQFILNDITVPIPNSQFENDFAISTWVLIDSYSESSNNYPTFIWEENAGLVMQGEAYNGQLGFNCYFLNNYNIGGSQVEDGHVQSVTNLSQWNHVVLSNQNGINSLYVNGTLADVSQFESTLQGIQPGNFLKFGAGGEFESENFFGKLDDIGIWNRALTAEEVALLYGNFTQTIPGCTNPLAFNYNPEANVNEGCLYTASVFVYNDLNGNGEHESNEPGLSNWPVVGNDINGLLWTNGNGNAFVAVPQGAYQFTVLNTTDNWVLTTEASGILSVGSNTCTDQAGNPYPCPNSITTISFGLQVIPGEAIVAAGPFTGFWDILHCTDGYESGVYLENIGSQTVSGFMTLTCDPLFTPNASNYFTTPPTETGPGYALWNIEDFLPGEYELLSYFVPGPGVEYLNAVFNFSLELTLLDPQGNIIFDETWDASPIVACAYDPNDLTGYPEGLSAPHKEGYTIEHFMRPDNMVEFRVRFQNTGTLPAEDIDIYIPIDASVWDLSTIEPLARAADMQVICLHDSGDNFFNLYDSLEHELPEGVSATDLLIFSFEDIFLPDSASDPDGSQGYVFFQMQAKHGLDVNTELNAQAFIYFEQNPPITTNETYHVIFDCESFTPMVGDTEICDGESLMFDATQPYVDTLQWQLNNVVIGNDFILDYPAEVGEYTLELITGNVLCSPGKTHEVTVIVHEIPELEIGLDETVCEGEQIIFNGNSDGSIIWSNGATTGDTIVATESFVVTATVIGEGGCTSTRDWSVTVNPLPNASLIDDGDILVIGGVAWQWYFNGEEITGATANSISPNDAGNYYVIVTSEEGCTVQSETVVIDPNNVFVHSWPNLTLYPNPMKDLARIELPQGTFDVALYDITGACVRMMQQQQGITTIERASLASGVYQVRIVQGEQSKSLRLVIE
jgi:hypothetical protein